jgi:5-methylcytosine-specific restriction endonuclease McrA
VLTFKVASNGARFYRMQCTACGDTARQLSKADLSFGEILDATPFDEAKKNAYEKRRKARWEQLEQQRRAKEEFARQAENAAWRAKYDAHIQSPKWRALRAKVFRRSNGWCEGCGDRPAVEVHHLSYAHMGDEFLWELRAVCRECHERVHQE